MPGLSNTIRRIYIWQPKQINKHTHTRSPFILYKILRSHRSRKPHTIMRIYILSTNVYARGRIEQYTQRIYAYVWIDDIMMISVPFSRSGLYPLKDRSKCTTFLLPKRTDRMMLCRLVALAAIDANLAVVWLLLLWMWMEKYALKMIVIVAGHNNNKCLSHPKVNFSLFVLYLHWKCEKFDAIWLPLSLPHPL